MSDRRTPAARTIAQMSAIVATTFLCLNAATIGIDRLFGADTQLSFSTVAVRVIVALVVAFLMRRSAIRQRERGISGALAAGLEVGLICIAVVVIPSVPGFGVRLLAQSTAVLAAMLLMFVVAHLVTRHAGDV